MNRKKTEIFIVCFLLLGKIMLYGQDSLQNIKKGWTFGLLPAVAYDSDLGLKYGGLVNFYNFGDGTTYPNYKHSIYLEVARTTKGGGQNQLFFDSGHLFKNKNIRLTADLSWLTEQALDFYGFNGMESKYIPAYADENSPFYQTRMFYRHERKMLRSYADFQGKIKEKPIKWLAGLAFYNYQIATVDVENLNEGKPESKQLPDTSTLYDYYVQWGFIPSKEADGGNLKLLKLGLIYDTRNIEANPSKGMWSEMIIMAAPKLSRSQENDFIKLAITHRQYFTIIKNKLSYVNRFGYQTTIAGNTPFYFQPLMINSYSPSTITEGLGGAKSLRGVMRNRLIGDGFAYTNLEFRYKFINTRFAKQNIYFALNPFIDAGFITKRIGSIPENINYTEAYSVFLNPTAQKFNFTAGCGLHFALNENFVLSVNYGRALQQQNGESGLYIGTNWLF